MSNDSETITFPEFVELCEEAGISVDNTEVLEQDYRAGRALADVTDALITDQELHPAAYVQGEALEEMDITLSMLEEGKDAEGTRKQAMRLAVLAIRYLAENIYDEGKN